MIIDFESIPEQTPEAKRGRYGGRLRRAREGAGLSQRDVADRLKVDQKVVSRAEQGQASEETFFGLEGLYGLPDDYPFAPRDPVRRREWFDKRNGEIQGARLRGEYGTGKPPRGSEDAA